MSRATEPTLGHMFHVGRTAPGQGLNRAIEAARSPAAVSPSRVSRPSGTVLPATRHDVIVLLRAMRSTEVATLAKLASTP